MLTADRLRELLDYNRETGVFTWREPTNCRIKIGDIAGCICNNRVSIALYGKSYKAHRLAWLYVHGQWPHHGMSIDHIDGNPSNNAIANLREATNRENSQNRTRAKSDNKSAQLIGVDFHRRVGRYRARISLDGESHHIGYFDSAEEAHAAYIAAKSRLHPFSAQNPPMGDQL